MQNTISDPPMKQTKWISQLTPNHGAKIERTMLPKWKRKVEDQMIKCVFCKSYQEYENLTPMRIKNEHNI